MGSLIGVDHVGSFSSAGNSISAVLLLAISYSEFYAHRLSPSTILSKFFWTKSGSAKVYFILFSTNFVILSALGRRPHFYKARWLFHPVFSLSYHFLLLLTQFCLVTVKSLLLALLVFFNHNCPSLLKSFAAAIGLLLMFSLSYSIFRLILWIVLAVILSTKFELSPLYFFRWYCILRSIIVFSSQWTSS